MTPTIAPDDVLVELGAAIRLLNGATKGTLPHYIPNGIQIVEYRVIAERNVEEVFKALNGAGETIPTLLERERRLVELVELAYREGHLHGRAGRSKSQMNGDWLMSDANAALTEPNPDGGV